MGRWFYLLWLVAAALAAIGAATDTSYHFAYLFDTVSLPHAILVAGLALYVALLLWALSPWMPRVRAGKSALTGRQAGGEQPVWSVTLELRPHQGARGAERIALLLTAVGIGLFLVVIPLDVIWHTIYGVDITTWSPTHLSLNYTSDIAHIGIFAAWLASPGARRAGAWRITLLIAVATLLAVHYPLYQQEYGAVAADGLLRTGRPPWYVEPQLLILAGPHAFKLIAGGAPDWLYLVYSSLVVSYALALGALNLRRVALDAPRLVRALPATLVATGFVLVRVAFRLVATALGMPVAVVPWYLVAMGLALDAALALTPALAVRFARAQPTLLAAALGGAVAALALFGGIELLRAGHIIVPATPVGALPAAVIAGAAGALLGAWLASWMDERVPRDAKRERLAGIPARGERVPAVTASRRS